MVDTIKQAQKKVVAEPNSMRIGKRISLSLKHGFNRDGKQKGFLERKITNNLRKSKQNMTEAQRKLEQINEERMREMKKAKMERQ
jgi:hypothetical protein